MPSVTRAVRFAVRFAGARKKDLEGTDGLPYQLSIAQSDATRAANNLIEVLSLLDRGLIAAPLDGGKPRSSSTLAYQALTGMWDPWGSTNGDGGGSRYPIYVQKTDRPLCGGCRSALATFVADRLKNDEKARRKDTARPRYSTFGQIPIMFRAQEVRLEDDGGIRLTLWARETGSAKAPSAIKVRPAWSTRSQSQKTIVARIRNGEYKHGSASLWKDARTKKWMLAISWSGEAKSADGPLLMGVHLGIATTASCACIGLEDGKLARFKDRVLIPKATLRALDRFRHERSDLSRLNRQEYGLREGHGRGRKLRVTALLSDSYFQMVQTAVRQTAAAIVKLAQKRGVSIIAIEDLKDWSVDKMLLESEALLGPSRKRARHAYFRWHQGALREAIKQAAELAGIFIVEVSAAHDSNTCCKCDTVWPESYKIAKKKQEKGKPFKPPEFGRVSWGTFRCSCGHEDHADRNAANIVAMRGLAEWPAQKAAAMEKIAKAEARKTAMAEGRAKRRQEKELGV